MGRKDLLEQGREHFEMGNSLCKALLGEFIGTTILLLVGNSVVAQNVLSRGTMNEMIGVNVGFGLAITFAVASCARVSGGHVNPAVSLMFLSFGKLRVAHFFLYVVVQMAGAFTGATLTFILYYDSIDHFDKGTRHVKGPDATAGIFSSYPSPFLGAFNGLIDQIVATAVFCFCIAHLTDSRNGYPTWAQPPLVGASFVMIGTAFSLNCGYPVNPARDLAPRIFTAIAGYQGVTFSRRKYNWFWVPIVGPFIGAVAGGWLYQLTLGLQTPDLEPGTPRIVALDHARLLSPVPSSLGDSSPPDVELGEVEADALKVAPAAPMVLKTPTTEGDNNNMQLDTAATQKSGDMSPFKPPSAGSAEPTASPSSRLVTAASAVPTPSQSSMLVTAASAEPTASPSSKPASTPSVEPTASLSSKPASSSATPGDLQQKEGK